MEIKEERIFDFNGEYKLAKYPPENDGWYMTIRCGLSGIYSCINEWKNNRWQVEVLDASNTIAYSKEQLTPKQIKEWVKNEKNK